MPSVNNLLIFSLTEQGRYALPKNGTDSRGDIYWNFQNFPPFYGTYDGQVLGRVLKVYATGVETYDIFTWSNSNVIGYQIPKITYTYVDEWDSVDQQNHPLHWTKTWTSDSFIWDIKTGQNRVNDGTYLTEQANIIAGCWGKCHHTVGPVIYLGQQLRFPTITFDAVDDFFQTGDGYNNAHGHGECHIVSGGSSIDIRCEAFEGAGYTFLDIYNATFDFRFEGPFNLQVNPVCTDVQGTPIAGSYDVTLGPIYYMDSNVSDYYPDLNHIFTDTEMAPYKKRISNSTSFNYPIRECFHRCKVIHARGDGTHTWLNEVPLNEVNNTPVRSSLTSITVIPVTSTFLGVDDPSSLDRGYFGELRPLLRFNPDSGVTVKQIGTVKLPNEIDFSVPTWLPANDSFSTAINETNSTTFHCEKDEIFTAAVNWTVRPFRYILFDYVNNTGADISTVITLNQPTIGGVDPITHLNRCGPVTKLYAVTIPQGTGTLQIDTCIPFQVSQSGPTNICSLAAYNTARVTTQNNADYLSTETLVEKFAGVCALQSIAIAVGASDFQISNWRLKVVRGLTYNDLGHCNNSSDVLSQSHWGTIDGKDAFRVPAGGTPTFELNHLRDYQQFQVLTRNTSLPTNVWPSDITDLDDLLTKRFSAADTTYLGWVSNYDASMNRLPERTDLSSIPVNFTVAGNQFQGYMAMGDHSMFDPLGVFTLNCEMVLGNVVQATVIDSSPVDIQLSGTDIANNPFSETYTTDGVGNYGRHFTRIARIGNAGIYHYQHDIKHFPKKDSSPPIQLLWLTNARVAIWAGFLPITPSNGVHTTNDRYGRLLTVYADATGLNLLIEDSEETVTTSTITSNIDTSSPQVIVKPDDTIVSCFIRNGSVQRASNTGYGKQDAWNIVDLGITGKSLAIAVDEMDGTEYLAIYDGTAWHIYSSVDDGVTFNHVSLIVNAVDPSIGGMEIKRHISKPLTLFYYDSGSVKRLESLNAGKDWN